MKRDNPSFFYKNSLSLALLFLFLVSIAGQVYTGMQEYNDERMEDNVPPVNLPRYLKSGHFLQSTFENWESEFLQMTAYILLTVSLRQIGSSESKPIGKEESVDREPDPRREGAPWPVRKGGIAIALYKNSLSIAFALLFLASFALHLYGSHKDFNEEQSRKGRPGKTMAAYFSESRPWFESFQNWQSEFISVAAIVVLSIFLRQKGSPESKPVDTPNMETEG
ncbi:MAG: hypothetical protein DIU61_013350 [Bacteroidota bacterium]|jgi:hypothetical protein